MWPRSCFSFVTKYEWTWIPSDLNVTVVVTTDCCKLRYTCRIQCTQQQSLLWQFGNRWSVLDEHALLCTDTIWKGC